MLDGATVTDLARRNGVVRRTVHDWLRRYAAGGLGRQTGHVSEPVAPLELVEVPEAAYVSNNLSNEPRRTEPDDDGRAAARDVADLHEHGRRRTTTDPPGRQTAGS